MQFKNRFTAYFILIFLMCPLLKSMDGVKEQDLLNEQHFIDKTYLVLLPADVLQLTIKLLSHEMQNSLHYESYRVLSNDDIIKTAEFDPSGERILTTSEIFGNIWTIDGMHLVKFGDVYKPVNRGHFSPQGDTILGFCQNKAHVWTTQGVLVATLDASLITDAQFDPTGSKVVIASLDGTAKVFTTMGTLLATCRHDMSVNMARFNSTGDKIVTASHDRTAKLWNLNGWEAMFLHERHVQSAQFNKTGDKVVTASDDKTAKVWTCTGKLLATFTHDKDVRLAQFNSDGDKVLTVAGDTVKIWKVDGSVLCTNKHISWVISAEFNPQGTKFITISDNVRISDYSGIPHFKIMGKGAAFNPNGTIMLTITPADSLRLWRQAILKLTLPETIFLLTIPAKENLIGQANDQIGNFNDHLRQLIKKEYASTTLIKSTK